MPFVAILVRPLLRMLLATHRVTSVTGAEHFDQLVQSRTPAILAFWHNQQISCGHLLQRQLLQQGYPIVGMASTSRDGELAARFAQAQGFQVVRGSTYQDGLSAALKLYRVLVKQRLAIAIAPDGPRGPAHKCNPGTVELARLCGTAIIPVASAAERFWRLTSWDRLIIPRPFSRVAFVVGEPMHIPKEPFDRASEINRLEARLNELVEQAESEFAK